MRRAGIRQCALRLTFSVVAVALLMLNTDRARATTTGLTQFVAHLSAGTNLNQFQTNLNASFGSGQPADYAITDTLDTAPLQVAGLNLYLVRCTQCITVATSPDDLLSKVRSYYGTTLNQSNPVLSVDRNTGIGGNPGTGGGDTHGIPAFGEAGFALSNVSNANATAYQMSTAATIGTGNPIMPSLSQMIDLPATLPTHGEGQLVAILDTGIGPHPDFRSNPADPNSASVLQGGYNFVTNSPVADDSASGTIAGHGTGVAGMVHLVAPASGLMPVTVLTGDGGTDLFTLLKGIVYAAQNNATIINMSLSTLSYGANPRSLQNVIAYAGSKDAVVIASSGNDDDNKANTPTPSTPAYPCGESGVMCVSAVDRTYQHAVFETANAAQTCTATLKTNCITAFEANYGSAISISAPGTRIVSLGLNNGYQGWEGTSFASPIVAGGAALLRAAQPGLHASSVVSHLAQTARNIDNANPNYVGMLGGCVDVAKALGIAS